MKRSTLVATAAIAVGVVAVVLMAGVPGSNAPLSPDSTGPDGTRALASLMKALGQPVEVLSGTSPSSSPTTGASVPRRTRAPSPLGYALVLSDSDMAPAGALSHTQRSDITDWVAAGGDLVIADPNSPLAALAGSYPANIAIEPGPGMFTNGQLGRSGDAARVARLLGAGSGAPVYLVLPSVTAGGTRTLVSMLDTRTRVVLIGLCVAVLIAAVSRARRFGTPVSEAPLVEVEGSVTVESMGRLMRRSRNTRMAAQILDPGLTAHTDSELVELARRR